MAFDYSKQSNLPGIVALTPEERAADAESAKATIYELDQEIARARANNQTEKVAILTAERERISGQTKSVTDQLGDYWDSIVNAPRALMDKTTGVDSSKPEEAGILGFFTRWIPSIGVIVLGIVFVALALLTAKNAAPTVVSAIKGKI